MMFPVFIKLCHVEGGLPNIELSYTLESTWITCSYPTFFVTRNIQGIPIDDNYEVHNRSTCNLSILSQEKDH